MQPNSAAQVISKNRNKTMKRILFLLALLALLAPLWGWSQKSETRSVGSFSGIKTGQAIDVYLKKGEKESVKVEVTGDYLDRVITEVSGSNLRIHIRDNNSFFSSSINVKVYVTYVALSRIYASQAANVFSDGVIKAEKLDIQASSAADIELKIEAGEVNVQASSAADVTLEGTAKRLVVSAVQAGEVDAYACPVEIAEASASSGGGIKMSVSQSLDAKASSGGSVRYRGNPARTNTSSSSGGSVKKAS
jgi:hypothetical protein